MTRAPWTTVDQRAWLEERRPQWLEANATGQTKTFRPQLLAEWYKAFPLERPTAEELKECDKDLQAAEQKKRRKMDERVFQWYYNKTRETGQGKRGTFDLSKERRAPAAWQAYQTLYWEDKLKTLVNAELESLREGRKDGMDSAAQRAERILVQSRIAKAEYLKESDDVKAAVEKYVEEKRNRGGPETPEGLQSNIKRLSATLTVCLKQLQKQTGWMFTILGGGPSPAEGGNISTIAVNTEFSQTCPDFRQHLGEDQWEDLLSRWDEFLDDIFPEEVRAASALQLPLHTSAKTRATAEPSSSRASPTLTRASPASDTDSHVTTPKTTVEPRKLTYVEEREQNIARNHALLADLGLLGSFNELLGVGDSKKMPRKKGQKKKGPISPAEVPPESPGSPMPGCSQQRACPENATPTPSDNQRDSSDAQAAANSTPIIPSKEPLTPLIATRPTTSVGNVEDEPCGTHPTPRSEPAGDNSVQTTGAGPSESNVNDCVTATSPAKETTTVSSPHGPALAKGLTPPSDAPVPRPLVVCSPEHTAGSRPTTPVPPATPVPPVNATGSLAAPAELATAVGPPTITVNSGEASSGIAATSPEPDHTMDLDAPCTGDDPPDLLTPPAVTTPVVSLAPASAPLHVREGEIFFRGVTTLPAWHELVTKWLSFEQNCSVKAKLLKENRPGQVDQWLKRRRKFNILPAINLSEYIPEVRAWWISLQPEGRVTSDDEPLQQLVSEDVDWSSLAKAGPNGIFIFMLVLAWWAKLATTPALLAEFNHFVDDVTWALTMVLNALPVISGKRPHMDEDDDNEQPPKKRAHHADD